MPGPNVASSGGSLGEAARRCPTDTLALCVFKAQGSQIGSVSAQLVLRPEDLLWVIHVCRAGEVFTQKHPVSPICATPH